MSKHQRNTRGKRREDSVIMNDAIRARELRVVGDDKEQYGIIPREEALKIAEEKGLDLVLISPDA
ncbi:MAG TPA: translation initiation factor IF-3, partial [Nitratifractor salsuginis]|nr:translation initiation factor IF-3 [Nitratifractor salsuginis]